MNGESWINKSTGEWAILDRYHAYILCAYTIVSLQKHRVVMPKEEAKRRISRQSLVYFVASDNDVIIKPIDGSAAFEPITTKDFLYKRLDDIYTQ